MAVEHRNLSFDSHGDECRAELFLPEGPGPHPVVILCHGLGATREMRMDAFAEVFARAGVAGLTFTYRHFGDSGGEPRQLLDIKKQRQDIDSAIEFVKTLPELDGERVALFGSSFGGGHVIAVGARRDDVKAVISQCPFTDGFASGLTLGPVSTLKVTARAVTDKVGSLFGRKPVHVLLAGSSGEGALMTAPDVIEGYKALLPDGFEIDERVAARIGIDIVFERPGRFMKDLRCPAMICACENDTVAPYKPTARFAEKAPKNVELKTYPYGHFDIYVGGPFKQVSQDQANFLVRVLEP